jgi:WD repeat-containing protein 21A
MPNVVAAMPGRKAIVGVKRLKDSAVPWGLAASAMGDEVGVAWTQCPFWANLTGQMLIFDVRFGREPLHRLEGHVNNFHQNLVSVTQARQQPSRLVRPTDIFSRVSPHRQTINSY